MAWSINKIPAHVEWSRHRQIVVRYELSCFFSSHGAASGTALTRKDAERRLTKAQTDILLGGVV